MSTTEVPVALQDDQAQDTAVHREITARVLAYLDKKGIPERGRVSHVAEITGLSSVQARRRLTPQGPPWVIDELAKLASFYGESLGQFLGGAHSEVARAEVAEIEIAGTWYGAAVQLGKAVAAQPNRDLVAVRIGQRLKLMQARDAVADAVCHEVLSMKVFPKASQNIRIAILDDDLMLAESLRGELVEADFSATAFGSEDDLAKHLPDFDAFIIDFVLAPGRTASTLVESIRRQSPQAPIIVLTGHARDASNREIANLVRTFAVDVQEKPADVVLLLSLIEGRLVRQMPRTQ